MLYFISLCVGESKEATVLITITIATTLQLIHSCIHHPSLTADYCIVTYELM